MHGKQTFKIYNKFRIFAAKAARIWFLRATKFSAANSVIAGVLQVSIDFLFNLLLMTLCPV